MAPSVHLIKLCVGAGSVEDLIAWQAARIAETGQPPAHLTRMWPKRAEALLAGGSLYWVIKGAIQARQRLLRLDEAAAEDGTPRCALVLAPEVIRTEARLRRPFQGWRYLEPADAPPDLAGAHAGEPGLPASLAAALSEIGVLKAS